MTPSFEVLTHPWYHTRHHTRNGFRNLSPPTAQPPFWKAVSWFLRHRLRQKENVPPHVHRLSRTALLAPHEGLRLTWLGHSAFLLQTGGASVLLDPMLGERASPFSFAGPLRLAPPPIAADGFPDVDVVILSHDHYDHLDRGTVDVLERAYAPLFVAPLGVGQVLRGWGVDRVIELDWGQYVEAEGLTLHCTPARHFSGRSAFNRNGTLWASWFVQVGEAKIFFAGDSGYGPHFASIRARLGPPDVALLPIGAYRPPWLMKPVHVDPSEAIMAFRDLEARHFIPMHWGTFDLAEEPIQEPPQRLVKVANAAGIRDRIHLLDVGGHFNLTDAGERR